MQISPHAAGPELCGWQPFCTSFGNSSLRDSGMTKQKGIGGLFVLEAQPKYECAGPTKAGSLHEENREVWKVNE